MSAVTWSDVAEWLNARDYDAEGDCPWCDLVGNAGGGPTNRERRDIVTKQWALLADAPFAPALKAWIDSPKSQNNEFESGAWQEVAP